MVCVYLVFCPNTGASTWEKTREETQDGLQICNLEKYGGWPAARGRAGGYSASWAQGLRPLRVFLVRVQPEQRPGGRAGKLERWPGAGPGQ